MKNVLLYFIASVLMTAIFSYSLKIFLKADFKVLTLKTMLIPCFTWSILLLSAFFFLPKEQKLPYFTLAAKVCMWGSAALVPAGIYNFLFNKPSVWISVISVFACVVLMSMLFFNCLKKKNISLRWWMAFNILISINMTLFYLAAKG